MRYVMITDMLSLFMVLGPALPTYAVAGASSTSSAGQKGAGRKLMAAQYTRTYYTYHHCPWWYWRCW